MGERRAAQEPGQVWRVVLLGLGSQYVHSALAPWCLAAGLKAYAKAPHRAQVVEGTVNEAPEAVLSRVLRHKPDILGISYYIWNIAFVEALLPLLRAALPDCVMVLGGPEVSFRARDALERFPAVDYVLAGEGEQPFALLVDALWGLGAVLDVPGLCCRTGDGVRLSPPHAHGGMQPSPYSAAYFEALNGRIAYLETSRGCPYSCAFCLSGRGEKLRQAPLERVYSEILQLAGSGAQTIKLVDRTFNADRARALQILRFIKEEHGAGIPLGVTFHFEIAGDLLDEPTLALVCTAPKGLFQFEIGLQSMDEATLKLVRRRTDMALLQGKVRRLIDAGRAHVHLDLIAGLPGEGLSAFARGFDQAYALRPQALQLGFLKLIHGSAMRENPLEYPCSFDAAPPYQVRETPWLSGADFDTLATVERALDKLHNAGRFHLTLDYLTRGMGLSPFLLFYALGTRIQEAEKAGSLPLDSLSNLLAGYVFETYPSEAARLRDLLLQDRLATVKTTVLPAALKQKDARYHAVKRALDNNFPRDLNSPRAIGFLYAGAEDLVVWCDYRDQDPVNGRYPLNTLPMIALLD